MKKEENKNLVITIVVVIAIILFNQGTGRTAQVLLTNITTGEFLFKGTNIDYSVGGNIGDNMILCGTHDPDTRSFGIVNKLTYSASWDSSFTGNNYACLISNTWVSPYHQYTFTGIDLSVAERIDFTGSYTLNGRKQSAKESSSTLVFGSLDGVVETIGLSIRPADCGENNYCTYQTLSRNDFSLKKVNGEWIYTDNIGTRTTTIPNKGKLFIRASANYYPYQGSINTIKFYSMSIQDLYITPPISTIPAPSCSINSDCPQNNCFGQTCSQGKCESNTGLPAPPVCSGEAYYGQLSRWGDFPDCEWSCLPTETYACNSNDDCELSVSTPNDCSMFFEEGASITKGTCINHFCVYNNEAETIKSCTDFQYTLQENKWIILTIIGLIIIMSFIYIRRRR